jgi:hypothetical protein
VEEIWGIEGCIDCCARVWSAIGGRGEPEDVADARRLLVLLREALGREATARADLCEAREGVLSERFALDVYTRLCDRCDLVGFSKSDVREVIGEAMAATDRPAGTLASLDDACDGSDR